MGLYVDGGGAWMPGCIHVLAGSVSTDRALSQSVLGHVSAAGAGACVIDAASDDEGARWCGSARIVIPRRVAVYAHAQRGRTGRTRPAACCRMVPVPDNPHAHLSVRPISGADASTHWKRLHPAMQQGLTRLAKAVNA